MQIAVTSANGLAVGAGDGAAGGAVASAVGGAVGAAVEMEVGGELGRGVEDDSVGCCVATAAEVGGDDVDAGVALLCGLVTTSANDAAGTATRYSDKTATKVSAVRLACSPGKNRQILQA